MSSLLQMLQSLLPSVQSQTQRDEAFLAQSVDIYDLERRMRTLDNRGRGREADITVGLYNR